MGAPEVGVRRVRAARPGMPAGAVGRSRVAGPSTAQAAGPASGATVSAPDAVGPASGGVAPTEDAAALGPVTDLTLDDLDYELPSRLVAQRPAEPRDASRLLVVRRGGGALEDRRFRELPGLLRAGDLLVRNDTRVLPARAFFRRASGGRVEALFLRSLDEDAERPGAAASGDPTEGHAAPGGAQRGERWEALLRGRPRRGEALTSEALGDVWQVRCAEALGGGRWVLESEAARPVHDLLEAAGTTPLPPYIREPLDDPWRYQTLYARVAGSAAAPTAGLHFTPTVDAALAAAGVEVVAVTLHVGLGTFLPLRAPRLSDNRLHGERFSVERAVWERIRAARREGRRVVAVGTTTVRVLEHLALLEAESGQDGSTGGRHGAGPGRYAGPGRGVGLPHGRRPRRSDADAAAGAHDASTGTITGETDLFITPGFRFAVVDALLTNFHLPRSSLLALVMAFCGVEATRAAYRHAVIQGYRFYSFGDAMLAL